MQKFRPYFLKNRIYFTFASLKKECGVVRQWELVRSKGLMQENILDTLDDFVRPSENFLQHFEANASQEENVFSLHEIGFLTLFFQKMLFFHVCFIKKGVWCPTTMRAGAFESLDVGEHSRYLG